MVSETTETINPLRCYIVEDDPISCAILENFCKQDDRIELLGSFSNAEDLFPGLTNKPSDLIFLDIELPGMSGIEFLASNYALPQIIVVTGNPYYAVDAFEFDATDFFEKPISKLKFESGIRKVLKRQQGEQGSFGFLGQLFVKVDRSVLRIDIADILYVKNVGDYINIYTTKGNFITHQTLKSANIRLSPFNFLKIHRTYIVNLRKIDKIEGDHVYIGNKVIPVSRSAKKTLKSSLEKL